MRWSKLVDDVHSNPGVALALIGVGTGLFATGLATAALGTVAVGTAAAGGAAASGAAAGASAIGAAVAAEYFKSLGLGMASNAAHEHMRDTLSAVAKNIEAAARGGSLPINHDLLRALRLSQLDAVQFVASAMLAKFPATTTHTAIAKEFENAITSWIDAERIRAKKADFRSKTGILDALGQTAHVLSEEIADRSAPDIPSLLASIWETAEKTTLSEIALAGVRPPQGFSRAFSGADGSAGFSIAAQQFFSERLKTDPRLRTVVFSARIERLDAGLVKALEILSRLDGKSSTSEDTLERRFDEMEKQLREVGGQIAGVDIEGRIDRLLAIAAGRQLEDLRRTISEELLISQSSDQWRGSLVVYDVARRISELQFKEVRTQDTTTVRLVRRFFGREDDSATLDSWLDSRAKGLAVVCAPSGGGKSALLAWWCTRRRLGSDDVVRHFVSEKYPSTRSPVAALQHLLVQIRAVDSSRNRTVIGNIPSDERELLDALHARLKQPAAEGTKLLVVVDAIDELTTALLDVFVRPDLGDGNYVIVSHRAPPGERPPNLARWLDAQYSLAETADRIDIPPMSEVDLGVWVRTAVPEMREEVAKRVITSIHSMTQGLPLFIAHALEIVSDAKSEHERAEVLSKISGRFSGFLEGYLNGVITEGSLTFSERFLMAVLTHVKGPIDVTELQSIINSAAEHSSIPLWSDVSVLDNKVGRWLSRRAEHPQRKSKAISLQFDHPLMASEFASALGEPTLDRALEALITWSAESWNQSSAKSLGKSRGGAIYPLQYLPAHLTAIGSLESAATVLSDLAFIKQRFLRLDGKEAASLMRQDWADLLLRQKRLQASQMYHARLWTNLGSVVGRGAGDSAVVNCEMVLRLLADTGLQTGTAASLFGGGTHWIPLSLGTIEGHVGPVVGVLKLNDGRLLSWGEDLTLRIWDAFGAPGRVLVGHTRSIFGALELANGRLLSWSEDGTLRLWSAAGDAGPILRGHFAGVWGALELADERIVSWSEDGTLRIWGADGEEVRVMVGHTAEVCGARVLSDSRILSWSADGTIIFWNQQGELVLPIVEAHRRRRRKGPVRVFVLPDDRIISSGMDYRLLISDRSGESSFVLARTAEACRLRNGRLLAWMGTEPETLQIVSVNQGEGPTTLVGHRGDVSGACVLANGEILSWSTDHTLRTWSASGEPGFVFKGHSENIEGALELADGRIISWSLDRTIRLWSAEGSQESLVAANCAPIQGVGTLDADRVLSWHADGTLRIWSTASGREQSSAGIGESWAARALADGRFLCWGYNSESLRLFSALGVPGPLFTGHSNPVGGALALNDGRLLSWSWNELRIWSTPNKSGKELPWPGGGVTGAIQLFDGQLLSWGYSKLLRLWDEAGEPGPLLSGHAGAIGGALQLANGDLLSWSHDRTLRLWSTKGELKRVLVGHSSGIEGALQDSRGRLITWSYGDRMPTTDGTRYGKRNRAIVGLDHGEWAPDATLRMWATDGSPGPILAGHSYGVIGALPLVDGRLVSWSWDESLRIWNAEGYQTAVLKGHEGTINGAMLLADGRLLSWSDDRTLRFWDLDGNPGPLLPGHTGAVEGALQLADGRIVSWSLDGTLRKWDLNGQLLQVWVSPNGGIQDLVVSPSGHFGIVSERSLLVLSQSWAAFAEG